MKVFSLDKYQLNQVEIRNSKDQKVNNKTKFPM